MTVAVFVSDVHFPDHDPAAWRLALRLWKIINPTLFWWGGDIFDFTSPSSYLKDPAHLLDLQSDLDIGFAKMLEVRNMFPNSVWYAKEGNHEQRLKKFLFSRAAELSPLRCLRLENLLRLNELDCQFVANEEHFKIGEMYFLHGNEERVGSVFPARNMYQRLGTNAILGHFHRQGHYQHRTMGGKVHGVWVNSCLQNLEVPYAWHTQWSQGFTIITFTKSGKFNVEPITFFREKGRVCYVHQGKLMVERYKASEQPEPIREHRLVG